MQLEQLTLRNIGPFAERVVRFAPGLNAIIGPNGSGKSTILDVGLYGVLTGELGEKGARHADSINDLADEEEESSAELLFGHAGHRVRAFRSLRPAGRELVVDGGKPVTSDREFQRVLYDLLDVDQELLESYVFVAQWEVFSVLTAPPARRAQALQKLFRLDHVGRLYQLLGEELAVTRVSASAGDVDQLAARLAEARERERSCRDEIAALYDGRGPLSARDWQAEIDAFDRAERVRVQLRRQRDDLRQVEAGAVILERREEARLREELAAGAVLDATAAAAGADDVVRQHEEAARQDAELADLTTELERLARVLERPAPARPVEPEPGELATLVAEAHQLQAFLEAYDPDLGRSACPTCGTPGVELRADRQARQRRQAEVAARIDELTEQQRLFNRWRGEQRAHQTAVDQASARVDALSARLDQIAAVRVDPAYPLEEAQRRREEKRRADAAHYQAKCELQRLEAQAASWRQTRDRTAGRLVELEAELAGLPPHPDVRREDLVARRDEAAAAEARVATLQGKLDALLAETARLSADLDEARQTSLAAREDAAWREHLTLLRAPLHHSALPAKVTRRHLDDLAGSIDSYLELFGAPFRCAFDDALTFRATFPRGRTRKASRLSGGQKVVLSLAFRLSVNARFAGRLGLLCLDEPTVGLDRAHLRALEPALDKLRELSAGSNLQVVMVTHEPALAPLFDHVIELEGDHARGV